MIYSKMFSCGRKICLCQKEIINWYMRAPNIKNKIFQDQLEFLKKKKKYCSGYIS